MLCVSLTPSAGFPRRGDLARRPRHRPVGRREGAAWAVAQRVTGGSERGGERASHADVRGEWPSGTTGAGAVVRADTERAQSMRTLLTKADFSYPPARRKSFRLRRHAAPSGEASVSGRTPPAESNSDADQQQRDTAGQGHPTDAVAAPLLMLRTLVDGL